MFYQRSLFVEKFQVRHVIQGKGPIVRHVIQGIGPIVRHVIQGIGPIGYVYLGQPRYQT